MLKWLGVQKEDLSYKFSIWSKNYKNIKTFHTRHQKNIIKKIQMQFQTEVTVTPLLVSVSREKMAGLLPQPRILVVQLMVAPRRTV